MLGLAGIAYEKLASTRIPFFNNSGGRTRGGYRTVPIDEDAQVLRFEDEEE